MLDVGGDRKLKSTRERSVPQTSWRTSSLLCGPSARDARVAFTRMSCAPPETAPSFTAARKCRKTCGRLTAQCSVSQTGRCVSWASAARSPWQRSHHGHSPGTPLAAASPRAPLVAHAPMYQEQQGNRIERVQPCFSCVYAQKPSQSLWQVLSMCKVLLLCFWQ